MHKFVALDRDTPLRVCLGVLDNALHHLARATPLRLQVEQAILANLCGICLRPLKVLSCLDNNLQLVSLACALARGIPSRRCH